MIDVSIPVERVDKLWDLFKWFFDKESSDPTIRIGNNSISIITNPATIKDFDITIEQSFPIIGKTFQMWLHCITNKELDRISLGVYFSCTPDKKRYIWIGMQVNRGDPKPVLKLYLFKEIPWVKDAPCLQGITYNPKEGAYILPIEGFAEKSLHELSMLIAEKLTSVMG